ncbi:unnamed protein product [Cuscuta europaea]|uniref:Reverse transcriptase domain-containing protein n=1 Tax=Cuscuta europaea TaxID=41803 RepID=A0A9P0YQF4_CUSEU|nr:unnamed protein product [Cuscuta europaea]
MWLAHSSFMEVVKKSWNSPNYDGGMRGLVKKLQNLKRDLKIWNLESFGNIFDDIKTCESEVLEAEKDFENDPTPENREKWSHYRSLLVAKYKIERKFWKQKANIKWLKEGDANTIFFHSYAKMRKKMYTINSIQNTEGEPVNALPDIASAAIHFFKDLYSVEPTVSLEQIQKYIPKIISEEDNYMMTKLPEEEEVKAAVWDLNSKGAPGPDGFNGIYFKKCWSIVCTDVVKAIQKFFWGISIPKGMVSSWIILIPKKGKPSSFAEFMPICLSNFVSKIYNKVLASRLNDILPKIISKEQAGFMKGRDIADQILVAQEMIHSIDMKIRGSNVVVKLDMAKAFDKVSWSFLSDVLSKFGFSELFIHIVMNNLKSTYLSILVNGIPHGFLSL